MELEEISDEDFFDQEDPSAPDCRPLHESSGDFRTRENNNALHRAAPSTPHRIENPPQSPPEVPVTLVANTVHKTDRKEPATVPATVPTDGLELRFVVSMKVGAPSREEGRLALARGVKAIQKAWAEGRIPLPHAERSSRACQVYFRPLCRSGEEGLSYIDYFLIWTGGEGEEGLSHIDYFLIWTGGEGEEGLGEARWTPRECTGDPAAARDADPGMASVLPPPSPQQVARGRAADWLRELRDELHAVESLLLASKPARRALKGWWRCLDGAVSRGSRLLHAGEIDDALREALRSLESDLRGKDLGTIQTEMGGEGHGERGAGGERPARAALGRLGGGEGGFRAGESLRRSCRRVLPSPASRLLDLAGLEAVLLAWTTDWVEREGRLLAQLAEIWCTGPGEAGKGIIKASLEQEARSPEGGVDRRGLRAAIETALGLTRPSSPQQGVEGAEGVEGVEELCGRIVAQRGVEREEGGVCVGWEDLAEEIEGYIALRREGLPEAMLRFRNLRKRDASERILPPGEPDASLMEGHVAPRGCGTAEDEEPVVERTEPELPPPDDPAPPPGPPESYPSVSAPVSAPSGAGDELLLPPQLEADAAAAAGAVAGAQRRIRERRGSDAGMSRQETQREVRRVALNATGFVSEEEASIRLTGGTRAMLREECRSFWREKRLGTLVACHGKFRELAEGGSRLTLPQLKKAFAMSPEDGNPVLERLFHSCRREGSPGQGWSLMDYLRLVHTKLRESPEERAELVFRVFSHHADPDPSEACPTAPAPPGEKEQEKKREAPPTAQGAEPSPRRRRLTVTRRDMAAMARSALDLVECGARSPRGEGLDQEQQWQILTTPRRREGSPASAPHRTHGPSDDTDEEGEESPAGAVSPGLVEEARAALETSVDHALEEFGGHGSEALDHDSFVAMCQASAQYQQEAEGWGHAA